MGREKPPVKVVSVILTLFAIGIIVLTFVDTQRELDMRENGVRLTATYAESDLEGFVEKEKSGRRGSSYIIEYEFNGKSYREDLTGVSARGIRVSIGGSLPGPQPGDSIEIVIDEERPRIPYPASDVDSSNEWFISGIISFISLVSAVLLWKKES